MEIKKEESKMTGIRYEIKDIFPFYLEICSPQTPEDIQTLGEYMKREIDVEVKDSIKELERSED